MKIVQKLALLIAALVLVAPAAAQKTGSDDWGSDYDHQGELTEIEDSLQSARRYYNATVRDLNTRIQSFPNVLVARPMGFTEEEFYTDTDESIQTAPVVKFGAAKA